MDTIKINKGNQYDPDGYRIMSQEDGRSTVTYAYGSIGKRGDGTIGLTRNGFWGDSIRITQMRLTKRAKIR